MNPFDRLHLLAQLDDEYCGLNHGPSVRHQDFPAVNYLVLPVGHRESTERSIAVRELVIPVCLDCMTALQGEEWTLLYCFLCNESRWVCRQLAKNSYRHHVLWLRGCPDCTGTFGGLYFNDLSRPGEEVKYIPVPEPVAA